MRAHIVLTLAATLTTLTKQEPLVVVPAGFRWNASNEILLTPLGSVNHLVDVHVQINAIDIAKTIYRQNLQARIPGSTIAVKFDVPGGSSRSKRYHLIVKVENDKQFEATVPGRPDVRIIRLITDKVIYRPVENVRIRALPIRENGSLYSDEIEISLVNPDGFELIKKLKRAEGRFIATEFQLPEHLNFGEWKIIARAVGDSLQNSFVTSFDVEDYVLPPYRVSVTAVETEQWDVQTITVVAKYPHGTAVSGNIVVRCESASRSSKESIQYEGYIIAESELTNGYWSERTNVRVCYERGNERTFTVSAEVREWGAGSRVESKIDVDTQLPGFELVPLRPGFKSNSPHPILILARASDGRINGANMGLKIETTCVCKDREKTKTPILSEADIGRVFSISLGHGVVCRALTIHARRKIGSRYSRRISLILPSFDGSEALEFGWISASLPQTASFTVGDKFRAHVPTESAPKLNYLVVCNGASIAIAGRARDDGLISFEIRAHMVHQCVLYVFSIEDDVRTDMLLFFVEQRCPYSLSVSKATISPGETINISLRGAPYGLATLSAIDQRMYALLEAFSSAPSIYCWDLSFFNKPELKDDQARFLNFLNAQALIDSFNSLCHEAGILLLRHLKVCPIMENSPSLVSNQCMETMVQACEHTLPPTSSTVCDRKSDACEMVKLAGMAPQFQRVLIHAPLEQMKVRFDDSKASKRERRPSLRIREFFPEVWFFDDFHLGKERHKTLKLNAPDSVTQWALSSSLWASGDLDTCSPKAATVTSVKDLFISVELPTHVYVNETITARVTVIAENIDEEKLFSVCLTGLQRHVCGDVGVDGYRGQPTYARVEISPHKKTVTKTFTLRFLSVGESEVIFKLKEEDSYPGKYHCDVGTVYDMVKMKVTIAKRAETEEHFKRIILNSEKPLNKLTRSPEEELILLDGENGRSTKDIIEYSEYRPSESPRQLRTDVRINLADTETVYSFTIELSKFLSTVDFVDELNRGGTSRRDKRAVWDSESFLTDVIKSLSSALYRFKSLHLRGVKTTFKKVEYYEARIGSLMSEMLTFSDCHGNGSCGFALYRSPQKISDRSVFLSTLSTSLLCEANADERIVCPALTYLLSVIEISAGNIDDRLLNQIDFKTNDDRIWFLTAMFNQLASDCGIYQCLRNDRAWIRLRRSFLNLSSNTPTDVRTVAALAFMAPKTTADIMRIKMYTSIQDGMLPYWTAGSAAGVSLLAKLRSRYNDLLGRRSAKSGDVLANSLGVLAFISRGIEPAYRIMEFDSLVDWIVEQLDSEQDAPTAVETYFANRAVYEYRSRKHNPIANEPQMVTVSCSACRTNSYNVSDRAVLFYLPHSVRSVTFTTEGHSKIRVGVRILAKKRQRLRRELDQDDYYPVSLNVVQQKVDAGALRQQVCLRLETAMIDSLEITHGLFTGFSTTSNHFRLLPNTTFEGVRLVSPVVVSSYAAHFILSHLKPKLDLCYELGSTEPRNRYQPDRLAPVAITARHASYDVIGQSLITHVDRSKRANIDESIDTICWQGTCSCAETTCTVRCAQCRGIDKSRLRAELCAPQSFGAAVEVKSVREESLHGARYAVIDVSLEHWKHLRNNTLAKANMMEVWLRACNRRCVMPQPGDNYYFGGNSAGIVVDHNAKSHYVLREEDRWEKAVDECGHLFSHLFTINSCA